ncbi:hypothetical protein D6810_03255 [Candidatus Dojkabacteria bacterium]|uniref:Uncharacterized protein n=1 Tax=Candidatus Dojkabacteria bacterium TaxID=2099670 RepID=A0A3M0YZ30_9BACT|nr:MAG: hypothetical protein D6810_03255 [Candidatus Dojkabacteria bacterium]
MNDLKRKAEEIEILEKIYKELQRQNKSNLILSFLRGLATGLGITIGTSILITILILVLRQFVSVPVIGEYIKDIVEFVESTSK